MSTGSRQVAAVLHLSSSSDTGSHSEAKKLTHSRDSPEGSSEAESDATFSELRVRRCPRRGALCGYQHMSLIFSRQRLSTVFIAFQAVGLAEEK